jgi:hypothetical protein
MFSGRHEIRKEDGKYFIDRDPDLFKHLIQYLRNGCQKVEMESKRETQLFELELDFWGINTGPNRSDFEEKLLEIFTKQPSKLL